jgi:hypothetical protein
MKENILVEKNQKTVKVFTWILLVASALVFLSAISGLFSSPFVNSFLKGLNTQSFKMDIHINQTPYIILASFKLVISAYILISAIFVLQYKEVWRKQIIIGIILAALYMLTSPLINYINFPQIHFHNTERLPINMMDTARTMSLVIGYLWSIAWSVFFIVAITKYNKREIKLLFSKTT